MDYRSDIKGRRKKRIRSLLEDHKETPAAVLPLLTMPEKNTSYKHIIQDEPDPEVMWKEHRGGWADQGNGRKPRFVAGFMRRSIASVLVFGAVWGIFAVQQPWSQKARIFLTDALSNDMDFEAARVWYEEHFGGAPAFIPIFGEKEEPAQKAAALHKLGAPVEGSIVQPFASTLKGVGIMPEADSEGGVTVKSVDMGRVLSVSREIQGGIRITVQHTGSITAEYGHLTGTKLEVDDWVQGGDTVGWIQEPDNSPAALLFFSVMKDKTYIDPAEVISFD